MTGWALLAWAAMIALAVVVVNAVNRWNRPADDTTELTVLAVENTEALIGYSHPTGAGMFWMGRRQILEHFVTSGMCRTVLRAENTDGAPIEMVVHPDVWAQLLEAV